MYKPKKIKVKNGFKWEVSFHLAGRNSKRIRRRFEKKIEAELFIKEYFNKDPDSIEFEFSSSSKTLKSESDFWLSIRGEVISPSHKTRVLGILKSFLIEYSNMPVVDINIEFLSHIRKKLLARGLSPATVNRWTNVLTTIVNHSFKHERIKTNPCSNFGLLSEFRQDMQFWERDEVSSFLSFANDKYSRDESMRWVYIVYLLALNTGLRAGEIWGLKVKDVSFDRGTIVIERQLLSKERVVAPTKGKNIRKVPCNHLLKDELLSLIKNKELSSGSFLFQSSNSKPIYHSNFRNRFFQVDLRDSGVKCIRFHDLRHTALTLMVESKINLKVVQSIAGHSDIQTTMRYVHLLASNIEEVSEIFILS